MVKKILKKITAILIVLSYLVFTPIAFAICNTNSGSFTIAATKYSRVLNNLGITGNVTIEAWVYPITLPTIGNGNEGAAVGLGRAATGDGYGIRYTASGGSQIIRAAREKHGVANNYAEYTVGDITNLWLHVVLTYDGTTVTLYTASTTETTHTSKATVASSGDGTANNNSDYFALAQDQSADTSTFTAAASRNWDGYVDDVRVWNTVRTVNQMDTNWKTVLVGNEAGLVAYYRQDNNWNDTTANAFNLTAVNSPTFVTTVPFAGTACGGGSPKVPDFIIFTCKHEDIRTG